MSNKANHQRIDIFNNRILVRNSHKFVYKKLCNANRDEWCRKYLSVATSKLLDPKHTAKLPFSVHKKSKTQQSNPLATNSCFSFPKKKTQVLAIHNSQDLYGIRPIDDEDLIKATHQAQKLLQKMKRCAHRAGSKVKHRLFRGNIKADEKHSQKQQFQIQPWMVQNQEVDEKQNKFF